jgi:nitrate reductase NapD
MNIYSLVVRALPEHLPAVKIEILAIPGAQLHQEHDGRLIITVEDVPGYRTSDALAAVQAIDHVISTTLAYEFNDDEPQAIAAGQAYQG